MPKKLTSSAPVPPERCFVKELAGEARTLAECIRAVIVVCAAVASQERVQFWELTDTYPMVTRREGG